MVEGGWSRWLGAGRRPYSSRDSAPPQGTTVGFSPWEIRWLWCRYWCPELFHLQEPVCRVTLWSCSPLLKSFCILKGGFPREGGVVGPPKADKEQAVDKLCLGVHWGNPLHSRWHQRQEGALLRMAFGSCFSSLIPWRGNDYPLQYFCLENSADRGAWWATVHRVAKSWMQLNDFHSLTFFSVFPQPGRGGEAGH